MYKLIISAAVAFVATVVFTDDKGESRSFTARLKAERLPTSADLDAALKVTPVFTDFLANRKLELLGWLGDCPLVSEDGTPAPAGPESLTAFLGLTGVPAVVFEAFVQASSAQAKLGN